MASEIPSLGMDVPSDKVKVDHYVDDPPPPILMYLFQEGCEIAITDPGLDGKYNLCWPDGKEEGFSIEGLSWHKPSLLAGQDLEIKCPDGSLIPVPEIAFTFMGPEGNQQWWCEIVVDEVNGLNCRTPTTGTFIAQDSSGCDGELGFVKSIGDHFKDRLHSENLECGPHSRGRHTPKGESMLKSWLLLIALLSSTANMAASQDLGDPTPKMSPPPVASADVSARKGLPSSCEIGVDRMTCTVDKSQRGTSLLVKEADIARLCGGYDGCSIRLGMYDWDGTDRVASREGLLYYNKSTHAWRSSQGNDPNLDRWGTDYDGVTQHVLQAWACYFTDGKYVGWRDYGDGELNFGLLSWNNEGYAAGCVLTIIR